MKLSHLLVAATLAIGLGGAASAASLAPTAAEMIRQPDAAVAFAKWKGHKGWKGNRGHHYGWYKPHRRAYYAPRRHYGWYRPHRRVYYAPRRHYGWYHHRRPARAVYFRY